MNGVLSLGLVRTLFTSIVPMSEILGVDADKRGKWKDIVDRLSAFPLQEKKGKTVFRYTEKGMAWCDSNTLGIQHIYPAGAIGLDSDPKLLEISRNMIDVMNRWIDGNGASSWYTACARVGYDPAKILAELRKMYDHHSMPNKLLAFGGGGIENVSPSLAVNEMLLQSHEGVIRFFPCWPRDLDARFGGLRAVGAFVISAEFKAGETGGVPAAVPCGVVHVVAAIFVLDDVQVLATALPFVLLPLVVVRIHHRRRAACEVNAVLTPRHANPARPAPFESRILVVRPVEQINLAVPHHGRRVVHVLLLPPDFLAQDWALETGLRRGGKDGLFLFDKGSRLPSARHAVAG
jgi:hypothetical protein